MTSPPGFSARQQEAGKHDEAGAGHQPASNHGIHTMPAKVTRWVDQWTQKAALNATSAVLDGRPAGASGKNRRRHDP